MPETITVEFAAKLLREKKNLQFNLSYRRVKKGIKSFGWKWTASAFHDNGAHIHLQGNTPEKAIRKLLKVEGLEELCQKP